MGNKPETPPIDPVHQPLGCFDTTTILWPCEKLSWPKEASPRNSYIATTLSSGCFFFFCTLDVEGLPGNVGLGGRLGFPGMLGVGSKGFTGTGGGDSTLAMVVGLGGKVGFDGIAGALTVLEGFCWRIDVVTDLGLGGIEGFFRGTDGLDDGELCCCCCCCCISPSLPPSEFSEEATGVVESEFLTPAVVDRLKGGTGFDGTSPVPAAAAGDLGDNSAPGVGFLLPAISAINAELFCANEAEPRSPTAGLDVEGRVGALL